MVALHVVELYAPKPGTSVPYAAALSVTYLASAVLSGALVYRIFESRVLALRERLVPG
jgi:hypothetical protein